MKKIDGLMFWGESLMRNTVTTEALLEQMKANEIVNAVLRPLKPINYCFDLANKKLGEMIKQYPQFTGLARVNPWEEDASTQVEKALTEYGLQGLHLHPWEENFVINASYVRPVMDVAEKYHVPVYVSAGYPNVSENFQVMELMRAYPDVTFVLTHGAQLNMSGLAIEDSMYVFQKCDNAYFDLSGIYRRDFCENLIRYAGGERIILGSNYPYMTPWFEIDRIDCLSVSDSEKEKVFSKNIQKIVAFTRKE